MLLEVILNTMNKKNAIMEKKKSKKEPSGDRLEWQNGRCEVIVYKICKYACILEQEMPPTPVFLPGKFHG